MLYVIFNKGEHMNKESRIKALELWQAGNNYSFIASELSVAVSTASRWIKSELESLQKIEIYSILVRRDLENQRLNTIQASFWEKMLSGDTRAARITLDCIDRRIDLYGLAMPKEHAITVQSTDVQPSRWDLVREQTKRLSDDELQEKIDQYMKEMVTINE
jgi:hypothetical protein